VSFIKRAQEAAASAAEAATAAAGAAKVRAGEAAAVVSTTAHDPATAARLHRQAREAAGIAKRGVSTVVERIDPSTLAEVVIKATALQEMTNAALQAKGSPYRIAEVNISASIPPGVTFVIARVGAALDVVTGKVSSQELLKLDQDAGDLVLALDGTVVDESVIHAVETIDAPDGAMPPTTIETG
jgi:hypothetical protein